MWGLKAFWPGQLQQRRDSKLTLNFSSRYLAYLLQSGEGQHPSDQSGMQKQSLILVIATSNSDASPKAPCGMSGALMYFD